MSFISFNKATDPLAHDGLHVNTNAVLYVEASRPDLLGQTTIHLLGQGTTVNAVTESIGTVVSSLGGLVVCKRHYLAPPPDDGASIVYVSPYNVSYVRPNLPASHEFWYIRFLDGSELRVMDPLPAGL
jgi:hypothetical protein